MRRKVNKNLLLGFIAPYILVILLVFTAQCISNSVVLNALTKNALSIMQNSFESNIGMVERNLERVRETALIVAQNMAGQLDNIDRSSNDFFSRITNIRNELSSYYAGNDIIRDICIQNDANDVLVNFETAYSRRTEFYRTMIKPIETGPEDLLKASEKANGFSAENTCLYTGGVEAIPFVFPTPIMRRRTGAVLVYVDKKKMLLPVKDLIDDSNGLLKVTNTSGEVIAQRGKPETTLQNPNQKKASKGRINNVDYYIVQVKGASSGWSYTAYLPENYALKGVQKYRIFSHLFNFFILIAGFFVCLFFTVRKSSSYLNLLEVLGIEPNKFVIKSLVARDEYAGLHTHISKIKDENKRLLETGNQNLLRKILSGQFEKTEDMRKELKSHKMDLSGSVYSVMVIKNIGRSSSEENIKSYESFMVYEIQQVIPKANVCFTEKDTIAVILPVKNDGIKDFEQSAISSVESEILLRYHFRALIGMGESVTELTQISQSYKTGCEVVDYNFLMGEQRFYYYTELPSEEDYYYPIEIENALFKSVLESDFEAARGILRQIQEENFAKRKLSVNTINELLAELRASIKKICNMQTEHMEFAQEKFSVNHFFEHAISFIYLICTEKDNESEIQPRGQKICREIRYYIELHYNDVNLSLERIADEFRLHPNYLSSMFKKNSGCNLVAYIENIRIEKAAALLSGGKYTVNEVAASVGFSNDSTFRRRFKKIKGVPPSTYLKN